MPVLKKYLLLREDDSRKDSWFFFSQKAEHKSQRKGRMLRHNILLSLEIPPVGADALMYLQHFT